MNVIVDDRSKNLAIIKMDNKFILINVKGRDEGTKEVTDASLVAKLDSLGSAINHLFKVR